MLTRYDPFHEALSLRRAMEQLFEQSFIHPGMMSGSSSITVPMDICEAQNGYEVDVALPGVRPEDIDMVVDQNTLTIRGHYSHQNEHQNQTQQQGQPQTQQSGQPQAQQQQATGQSIQQTQQGSTVHHQGGHSWLSREIVSGSFERSVTFPKPIDADKIQTTFQNGILMVQVPVSEASRPRHINVSGSQGQQRQEPVGAGSA